VGYTNAGKSTLFNQMTNADVFARDLLFATLDPTMRKYRLPTGEHIVLSDTVGFISNLPHGLIKAFHSTLEEVRGSSLLLHVIDVADMQHVERIQDVNEVLEELGAGHIPVVEVFNKIDDASLAPTVRKDEIDGRTRVFLSARTGEGVELLDDVLGEFFSRGRETRTLRLPPHAARMRARLHDRCHIVRETFTDGGEVELEVDVDSADRGWIERQEDFRPEYWL
jgi:GTP-binding protein HflX